MVEHKQWNINSHLYSITEYVGLQQGLSRWGTHVA